MITILILVVLGTTIWVGVDANGRDWDGRFDTGGWVVACLLLWIVVFPIYLVQRNKVPLKTKT